MNITTAGRKLVRILRSEGVAGVTERAVRHAGARWGSPGEPLFLRNDDVVDSSTLTPPPSAAPVAPGEPLSIGWVITVPGPASGGHTTIFRFVEAAEAAGHTCVLYIYDGQDGPAQDYAAVIRQWWPKVKAEIRDLRDGLSGMHAYVATAWVTAHALARHADVPGARLYLVQDFEPYFYPRGSAYELAEDTYRFGFRPITVGHMVAHELRSRFGGDPVVAEFGCDTDVYSVTNPSARSGVVFYAKPGVARRGYELGILALERLHARRPDIPIHTFGITARRLRFPATVHSHMTPAAVNDLYNRSAAGLALSFTNISLIANELLAAGVVPVVNDYAGTRADLDNEHVSWARSTPDAIADAILSAIDHQAAVGATALRASVDGLSWDRAKATVVEAIELACSGAQTTAGGTHS